MSTSETDKVKKKEEKTNEISNTEKDEKHSSCTPFFQNITSKILSLLLIFVYIWTAEGISFYIRTIDIGIIIDSVKEGEKARFVVSLANQLSQKKTVKVHLLTCAKEEDEFPIRSNVSRAIIYDQNKNLQIQNLNDIINKKNIKVLIYNDKKIYEMSNLFNTKQILIFINHDFYLEHLYFKESNDYFNLLKSSSLVIDFVPGQIPFYKKNGLKNILYLPKPIDYEIDKINNSNLKSKNILLFGDGDNFNKDMYNFNLGIQSMAKIVEKVKDAKLQIITSHTYSLQNIKEITKNLHIENNVEFITKSDKREIYYRDATILFLLSKTDSSPLYLLEAKAFGVPNIISGKKYIDSSKEGSIHVKENNPEEIAKEAIKLLTNKGYRKSKAREAIKSLSRFNNEHIVRTWINSLWAIYNEEGNKLILKQEKKMKRNKEFKNDDFMKNEFDLLKKGEIKFNCLNYNDIVDPIKGKPLKIC